MDIRQNKAIGVSSRERCGYPQSNASNILLAHNLADSENIDQQVDMLLSKHAIELFAGSVPINGVDELVLIVRTADVPNALLRIVCHVLRTACTWVLTVS